MKYAAISYTSAPLEQGYTDRVLKIDLSTRRITIEPISQEVKKAYVGGRGYCLKFVYDGTTAATRHDSPENVLALVRRARSAVKPVLWAPVNSSPEPSRR